MFQKTLIVQNTLKYLLKKGERKKMNWKRCLLSVILVGTLITLMMPPTPANAQDYGARMDEMGVYFFASDTALYSALKAGEIDFMAWPLTKAQSSDAMADPNIVLGEQIEMGMMEFDINNNYTMSAATDHRNPTSDVWLRRAISHCVDKDYIIEEILEDYASRMDVPLPYPQHGWWNPDVTGENYPYPYDLDAAAKLLDDNGWDDKEGDGIRNYPAGWPGRPDRPNMDPLEFYIRMDDPERTAAGVHLADNLNDIDVPVKSNIVPRAVCHESVMVEKAYHIYTGGWSLGRFPTTLFFLYNHLFYSPPGEDTYNYVTGEDEYGDPLYPDLDEALSNIYYAETLDMIKDAVMLSQEIFVGYAITISLWSVVSYQAWRSWMVGMVNMDCYGPENAFTFLNAYKTSGAENPHELRMGIAEVPGMVNPIDSQWVYEYQCIDRIYDSGRSFQPYNIYADQAWMIQDWNFTTYDGGAKNKMTLWFRKDISWVDPATGVESYGFTADDFIFSVWFVNSMEKGWNWDGTMDIDHVVKIDDYCVEIYYSAISYWFFYEYPPYWFPKLKFEDETKPLCTHHTGETYTVGSPELPITPGPLNTTDGTDIFEPVDVESCSASYYIAQGNETGYQGESGRPWIYINEALADGTTVTVDYWAGGDASGFYMGNLEWQDVMYGNGEWYPIDLNIAAGGWFKCARNSHYFMETPLLGEIDWAWHWGDRDNTRPAPDVLEGPRTGNFKVDLSDVVMIMVPYGTHGDLVPDKSWFPGADLAAPGGYINIYDAVCPVGPNYYLEFGNTP